jgi:hypothetical protein
MRLDVKKRKGHPTGMCGFNVTFDHSVFTHNDRIEVRTFPDNINIPLGKQAKAFLNKEADQ